MEEICIIVIFFYPSERQKQNAIQMSKDICVIAVDNSPKDSEIINTDSFKYFPFEQNKGIAYAQNYGIQKAREMGFKYILFQDQDSLLYLDQISKLLDEYKLIKQSGTRIAAIGPLVVNEQTGVSYKNELGVFATKAVSTIISSGMIVEIQTLDTVGGMEEDLFIDNVDHEWCWRAQDMGYKIFMTNKAILQHTVGSSTKKIGKLQFIKSSPIRYFYKYRNNILLVFRPYVPLIWKIKVIPSMLLEMIIFLLYHKEYGPIYYKNALKGVREAIKYKQHNG